MPTALPYMFYSTEGLCSFEDCTMDYPFQETGDPYLLDLV